MLCWAVLCNAVLHNTRSPAHPEYIHPAPVAAVDMSGMCLCPGECCPYTKGQVLPLCSANKKSAVHLPFKAALCERRSPSLLEEVLSSLCLEAPGLPSAASLVLANTLPEC